MTGSIPVGPILSMGENADTVAIVAAIFRASDRVVHYLSPAGVSAQVYATDEEAIVHAREFVKQAYAR